MSLRGSLAFCVLEAVTTMSNQRLSVREFAQLTGLTRAVVLYRCAIGDIVASKNYRDEWQIPIRELWKLRAARARALAGVVPAETVDTWATRSRELLEEFQVRALEYHASLAESDGQMTTRFDDASNAIAETTAAIGAHLKTFEQLQDQVRAEICVAVRDLGDPATPFLN